ncbi:hypothetical protein APR04_005022 [Promicromonospora umidemergens]|uniref:Uncharacterized protein n=1 Tax=Promicromonospora umidemergens TaxID=629679 RepID=A0ABP8X0M4_9MICO|nr:hypothetical protein [Promicromonospora umidemergens]MCP2286086.1 hypothetical protein [Promicromonospora umidemergens]
MNKKQDAANAAVNRSARPAMYAFVAAIVLCVVGVVLVGTAPDLFAALGGWVTVIVILFLIAVLAGLAIVRSTNRNADRTGDGPDA